MDETIIVSNGVAVAPPAWLRDHRSNPYGSVPGLEDEELASPEELERQVMMQEFGPVLLLPVRGATHGFRPELDDRGVDWGAFGTVDFARTMPEFDKARYKADMLKERLRDVIMMFETVSNRLPRAKWKVLKYVRMGLLGDEHIASWDMWQLTVLDRRIRKLRAEIEALRKASCERAKQQYERMLACWA